MGKDTENGGSGEMLEAEVATIEDSETAKKTAAPESEDEQKPVADNAKDPENYPRTITGVIRIMRSNGRDRAAEFMEELKDTKKEAERLIQSLQRLHKHRTGHYPQVKKASNKQSR